LAGLVEVPLIGKLSLHILNLFLDSVYTTLDIHNKMHNVGVAGLAADGVGLSEHLLTDKIQLAPRLPVAFQAPRELHNMRIEPGNLF
jgi:hypothetical protein